MVGLTDLEGQQTKLYRKRVSWRWDDLLLVKAQHRIYIDNENWNCCGLPCTTAGCAYRQMGTQMAVGTT